MQTLLIILIMVLMKTYGNALSLKLENNIKCKNHKTIKNKFKEFN